MTPIAANRPGALRATVLAAFCAALTAFGHLAGGGSAPDLTVLVVLLPLLAGVFTTFAERARSAVDAVAVLGLGQLALHQLLEWLNPAHAAHHATGRDLLAGAGMFAAHAVATLVAAAAVRYADRALDWLRTALRRVVPRRPPVLSADRPLATLATPGPAVTQRLARALAGVQVRRGPPVGC